METIGMLTYMWLFVFFMIGSSVYLFDMKYGVSFRKNVGLKLYNFFDKITSNPETYQPYTEEKERGYLYKRRLKTKLFYGMALSTALSVLIAVFGSVPLETKIIMWAFEVFFFNLGILMGPFVYNLTKGRKKVLEYIDRFEEKLENGETMDLNIDIDSIKKEAKEKFSVFSDTKMDEVESYLNQKIKDIKGVFEKEPEASQEEKVQNARDEMSKILGKK